MAELKLLCVSLGFNPSAQCTVLVRGLLLQPSRETQHKVGSWLLPDPAGPPGPPLLPGMMLEGAVPGNSLSLSARSAGALLGVAVKMMSVVICGSFETPADGFTQPRQIKLPVPAPGSQPGAAMDRVQGELPLLGALAGLWVPVLGAPRVGCGCSEIVPCVPGCRGATCEKSPGRNAGPAMLVARSVSCFCLCCWKSRALRCRQG